MGVIHPQSQTAHGPDRGGQGAFIGKVHSIAAILRQLRRSRRRALSSDPAKAKAIGPDYDILGTGLRSLQRSDRRRVEAQAGERVDFQSPSPRRTTRISRSPRLRRGRLNVMCDKPLTFDLAQAEELRKVVQKTGVVSASRTTTPAIRWCGRRAR